MFKFLDIKYFQSHRNTRLDFDPGVNIIFGLSQAGKSAVRKALQLLIDNRPSGARYYSNFASDKGKTIIELGLVEGHTVGIEKSVRRKPDKSKVLEETVYRLDNESSFSGVSKDVPDQIRDLLNLTELNMQSQFDAPFLVTSSAGEIARTINRITKLEDVDGWVSGLRERINDAKGIVKILEKDCQGIETELAKYVGFEDLQVDIDTLQKAANDLKVRQGRRMTLDNYLVRVEDIDRRLEKIKPVLSIQADIDSIQGIERQVLALIRRQGLMQRLKSIDIEIQGGKSVLGDLNELKTVLELEQKTERLSGLIDRVISFDDIIKARKKLLEDLEGLQKIQLTQSKLVRLEGFLDRIKRIEKEIVEGNTGYEEYKKKKVVILKGVKECPVFNLPCPSVKQMAEKAEKIL